MTKLCHPKNLPAGAFITLGNFDGVHKGHQTLVTTLTQWASDNQAPSAVVFFEPQPKEFFANNTENQPKRLSSFREKVFKLSELKPDFLVCLRFNATFASLSAHDFISDYLLKQMKIGGLFIGDDFKFGNDRSGNAQTLLEASKKYHFAFKQLDSWLVEQVRVSSSLIRKALAEGDLIQANLLLGYDYSTTGKVIHGDALGRTLGYPTANLAMCRPIPLEGVFAAWASIENNPKRIAAVVHVGPRLTLSGTQQLRIEAHLLDFSDNLYGKRLTLTWVKKIRNIQNFSGLDALKTAIAQDVSDGKTILANSLNIK
jgi:riboflavin kinase/FMN adenylyltransferase